MAVFITAYTFWLPRKPAVVSQSLDVLHNHFIKRQFEFLVSMAESDYLHRIFSITTSMITYFDIDRLIQ